MVNNINIPNKQSGDQFTADEFNLLLNGVNSAITEFNTNLSALGTAASINYWTGTQTEYDANTVKNGVAAQTADLATIIANEVTIGTQTWMLKNLDVNDGGGGIYAYNNDEANVATYGWLYTWDAAVRVAASVDGWHLPSDAEWTTLTDYLGGISVAGGKLKETGTTHWNSPNTAATNESGFTALPGGYRSSDSGGSFGSIGLHGFWWSATENGEVPAWSRYVSNGNSNVVRDGSPYKVGSYSVRLIKD